MARLCDLADPLVEVVYVAPFNLPEVSPFTKESKSPLRQHCKEKMTALRTVGVEKLRGSHVGPSFPWPMP